MDTLPVELLYAVTDESTRISLWWTAKCFRKMITLYPTLSRDTMLDYPCRQGHVEIIKWLYRTGLCTVPSRKNSYDAGFNGDLECVKFFYSDNEKEKHAYSVARGILHGGHFEAYQLVRSMDLDYAMLFCFNDAIDGGNLEILKDLVGKGKSLDSMYYKNVLRTNNLNTIRWLIEENGAILNASLCSSYLDKMSIEVALYFYAQK